MNITTNKARRLLSYMLLPALTLASSCTKVEDKALFVQSPAERMEAGVQELKSQLLSSPNGWILELTPHNKAQYGTYVVGLKFGDQGLVLATSEALEDKTGTSVLRASQKSSYEIGKDRGLCINFTTYNEAIHYYSTPDRQDLGAGVGKGLEGDYEFVLRQSTSPDTIRLMGKKTGRLLTMYRAPEPFESYVAKCVEMKRKLYTPAKLQANKQDALVLSQGGQQLGLLYLNDLGYNYYTLLTEDKPSQERLGYVHTPTGIRFTTLGSQWQALGASDFVWDEASQSLSATNPQAYIAPRQDPSYEAYAAYLGEYTMRVVAGDFPVRFEEAGYNAYTIKGLPYDIQATYDPRNDRFEIRSQLVGTVPNLYLSAWAPSSGGSLSWTPQYGTYSRLIEGSDPKEYVMTDNQAWAGIIVDSFILWVPGTGEYKVLQPNRLEHLKFIKK